MKRDPSFIGGMLGPVLLGAALALSSGPAEAADTVRPEVGKPLQEAATLLRSQHYREALVRINQADAIGAKTPYENYLIQRMRVSAAAGEGDAPGAATALEAVIASGRTTSGERSLMTEAVAVAFYREKDYSKAAAWTQRYLKEGGVDPVMHTMLLQSYYLANDCADLSRDLSGSARPKEQDLQLLANCEAHAGDKAAYASAMERLVTDYPKKEYWADLLLRTQAKPGFADRLDLDLDRLKLVTGNLVRPGDFVEMAQLALEAGDSAEAQKIVAQGYSSHILGVGPEAARHQRLRDLVEKQLAQDQKNAHRRDLDAAASTDGDALVVAGFAYVTAGQFDKGIPMMEQGIHRDNLRRPEDARLHLGIAYLLAGKKTKGRDVLRSIKGSDGTQYVARLWMIYAAADD